MGLVSLACFAATAAAASGPPTGRWEGELVGGAPSGHLGNPGHNVPLLGNGYLGLVLQSSPTGAGTHGVAFNGSTVEFFLNTNANWDCEPSKTGSLPPAVCSMRGLGGMTINAVNGTSAGQQLYGDASSFAAEQRMVNGSLWTRRVGTDASSLETTTWIHPEQNILLTTLTYLGPGGSSTSSGAPLELQLQLWTLGKTSHVRSSANSSCAFTVTDPIGSCSRRFNDPLSVGDGYTAPWTALANRVESGPAPIRTEVSVEKCLNRFECVSTATTAHLLHPGQTITLITTAADNLLVGNAHDPMEYAVALGMNATAAQVSQASASFWREYWGASSVALPSRPALERMWFGSQFSTAGSTASAAVVERMQGKLPPPGLYGPFATGDFAFWNGDFTLDYNQEANFYHVYSSNHPERAAAYFQPILDYMPSARAQAKRVAATAKLTGCDAKALNFPCHLAPWGQQSRDTRTYMQWNGPYAALLFINAWEYTMDAAFAKRATLPLLDGLNAWSHCYLQQDSTTGVLQDWNAAVPDQIFENGPAKNPSIGLALMMRVATAQRTIATAVGVPYPSYVDDIIAKLAPLPTTPGPGGSDQPVWAAADGRGWDNSSIFSVHFPSVLYAIYPAEVVDFSSPDASVARASAMLYANLTCSPGYPEKPYATCVDAGWGALTVFSALARTLPRIAPAELSLEQEDVPSAVVTAAALADAFETYIAAYGANSTNFLAYAPGGGVENIGLSQAVNDMLIQSSNGTLRLFPAWPLAEPAAFKTLRTKGALLVSASWDPLQHSASNVSITATVASPQVSLASPFPASITAVELRCSAQPSERTLAVGDRGLLQLQMAAGETCGITPKMKQQ